ncbi:hypothetical protein OIU78_013608 [Salix suchowensis]|nr:hypothetical protein OIU78_013608 [Salix suchowensis]
MWADQAAIRAGTARSAWRRMRLRAPPSDDLLLYAIADCVLQRRKLIVEKYSSMDEIMRECNSMAGQLGVWKLLDDAHDLVRAGTSKLRDLRITSTPSLEQKQLIGNFGILNAVPALSVSDSGIIAILAF